MGSRRCTDCGHAASDRARFCEQCGSSLVPGATPLRAPSALEAKMRAERTAIEGERKQVTVMYTDIVGSMDLTRALDSERWAFVLDRFLAIAAGAVHSFEGTVNQFTGDGLLAVFGAPLAHEDHARRACLAALELQREVVVLAEEVARSDGVDFLDPLRPELRRGGRRSDRRRRPHGLRAGGEHDRAGQADRGAGPGGLHGDRRVHRRPRRRRVRTARPRRVRGQGRPVTPAPLRAGRTRAGPDPPPGGGSHARPVTVRGPRTRSGLHWSPRWSARWPGRGGRWASWATRAWARVVWCTSSSRTASPAGWRSARPGVSLTGAMSRSCPCLPCSATTSASTSGTRPRSSASGSEKPCRRSTRRSRPTCRSCSSSSALPDSARPLELADPMARRRRLLDVAIGALAALSRSRGVGAGARGPALDRRRERRVPRGARRGGRRRPDPAGHHLSTGVRRRLDGRRAARAAQPRSAGRRRDRGPAHRAVGPRPFPGRARIAGRCAYRRQPVLHRGDRPGARRERSPDRDTRGVPARNRARGPGPAPDGSGGTRGAHRPAAEAREGAGADDVGDRSGNPLAAAAGGLRPRRERAGPSGGRARIRTVGHPSRLAWSPRVRVQAPADPGGRVRIPALGVA